MNHVQDSHHGERTILTSRQATLFPPEVWEHILTFVPKIYLQSTVLALSRALPRAGFPLALLLKHIHLLSSGQIGSLTHRLGPRYEDSTTLASFCESFTLNIWKPDPNVIVNLLTRMRLLKSIQLVIGGTLWTPENFDDLLKGDRFRKLEHLELRFNLCKSIAKDTSSVTLITLRTDVLKRSYYSFSAGAYFDNIFTLLSAWQPSEKFKSLAFVQDPLPRIAYNNPQRDGVAQPFVIYKTFSISSFIHSPFSKSLEALKLNIPDRSVVNLFSTTSTTTTALPMTYTYPPILPKLKLLDLSHTLISPNTIASIKSLLLRFPLLEHLLIDETLTPTASVLTELGSIISQTGSYRALMAMKSWRLLRERWFVELANDNDQNENAIPSALQPVILPPYSTLKSLCVGKEKVESNRDHYGTAQDFFDGYTAGLSNLDQQRLEAIRLAKQPNTILLRFKDGLKPSGDQGSTGLERIWSHLGLEPCTEVHWMAEFSLVDPATKFKLCLAASRIRRTSCWNSTEQVWNSDFQIIDGDENPSQVIHTNQCGHEMSKEYFSHQC